MTLQRLQQWIGSLGSVPPRRSIIPLGGVDRIVTGDGTAFALRPCNADYNSPRLTEPSPLVSSWLKTVGLRVLVPPAPSAFQIPIW